MVSRLYANAKLQMYGLWVTRDVILTLHHLHQPCYPCTDQKLIYTFVLPRDLSPTFVAAPCLWVTLGHDISSVDECVVSA